MSPKVRAVIQEVADSCGVAFSKVIGRCRVNAVVYARQEIARRLYADGYTVAEITRAVSQGDHSTICFYLGNKTNKPAKPRWHRPKIGHLINCHCHRCYFPSAKPPKPATVRGYLVPYAGAYWREYNWKERRP